MVQRKSGLILPCVGVVEFVGVDQFVLVVGEVSGHADRSLRVESLGVGEAAFETFVLGAAHCGVRHHVAVAEHCGP